MGEAQSPSVGERPATKPNEEHDVRTDDISRDGRNDLSRVHGGDDSDARVRGIQIDHAGRTHSFQTNLPEMPTTKSAGSELLCPLRQEDARPEKAIKSPSQTGRFLN